MCYVFVLVLVLWGQTRGKEGAAGEIGRMAGVREAAKRKEDWRAQRGREQGQTSQEAGEWNGRSAGRGLAKAPKGSAAACSLAHPPAMHTALNGTPHSVAMRNATDGLGSPGYLGEVGTAVLLVEPKTSGSAWGGELALRFDDGLRMDMGGWTSRQGDLGMHQLSNRARSWWPVRHDKR